MSCTFPFNWVIFLRGGGDLGFWLFPNLSVPVTLAVAMVVSVSKSDVRVGVRHCPCSRQCPLPWPCVGLNPRLGP